MIDAQTKPYPVGAIANFMIGRSIRDESLLTHLQLQKLVYIAYGLGLAILRRRLFKEEIQARRLGPVVPALYHEFKRFGPYLIRDWSTSYDYERHEFVFPRVEDHDGDALRVLNRTWKKYGHLRPSRLVKITHKPNTPWSQTSSGQRIEDELIRQHFIQLLYGLKPATATDAARAAAADYAAYAANAAAATDAARAAAADYAAYVANAAAATDAARAAAAAYAATAAATTAAATDYAARAATTAAATDYAAYAARAATAAAAAAAATNPTGRAV